MRLKRLEMVGFKSFAAKTRVEFEPGVTAIIGPNGCGKSNISDGIRWALGEMSAKSLRSQQMMDVIFNGTSTRASQGMSEVSLTFDNASGQLPLDYTEVTVSRRLFRSGESEYFINKTQCRLKDVRDLFLDTGVGNDGYYVMAQGKIEFILAAKPEERRELFEEAAGVSKYKARREEALRKLNKVEQDMLRLNDSLAIYKQQMDSLDAAVRKARQHQKLREEFKGLEIAGLLHGFDNAKTAWEAIDSQRSSNEQALEDLRLDLAQRETTVSEARQKAETLESEIIALQNQIAQSESEWAKVEAEKAAALQRMAEIREFESRLEAEAAQLETDATQWRTSLTTLTSEIDTLRQQSQAASERFAEEDQKGQVDQEALHAQQKALESTKSRLLELVRLIGHHRNETVRLTSLVVRFEEVSKSKDRELEKLESRKAGLIQQRAQQEQLTIAAAASLSAVEAKLAVLEQEQAADSAAIGVAEENILQHRERIAALEAERIALERWLAQDPSAMAVSELRRQTLPGIHGPVSELFQASGPYQKLLYRALGDRAHFFVADTLNDAQAAVSYLSDGRKGWATFLVLDRLSSALDPALPVSTPATQTLADHVVCDPKFRPVLNALIGQTFFLGETLFEETLIRGGAEPESAGFQATPTEFSRLLSDIETTQGGLMSAQSNRERLREQMTQREAARATLSTERQHHQVESRVQQESLSRIQEEEEMASTEQRLITREREEAQSAIAANQKALENEEILLLTLEEEEKTLQDSVQGQESTLLEKRQFIAQLQAAISQLRLESETLRERLFGREKEIENAQGRLESIESRRGQVQHERAENTERIVQLETLHREKSDFLASLESTRLSQRTMLTGILDMRQEIHTQVQSDDASLVEARQLLENAVRQAQESEFQARTLESEKLRFEQSLQESWQLSIEEARAAHGSVTPDPEELARIRKRLDSLGAVNLAAPEEYSQLQERYEFLQTQQQDLLKAKDDLHEAISKINATTREHFKATFELVRGHFRNLYQQLFRGGEADLILTDEQNLLETGVEIVAQPPGKKLQNITLLSGGEKTLTTIALLFAFFLVKPSPFCLLDEVDAPLDEANVGRFVEMVKNFAEKTQFIVITHNKRTMEMADVLYGVTMAELGVSSLISVKLESSKPPEPVAA